MARRRLTRDTHAADAKDILSAFWNLYLPNVQVQGWFRQLAPHLSALQATQDPADCAPLLERIAAYQRVAGHPHRLPKSLRKRLEGCNRRQRERQHLRARLARGELGAKAHQRLEYLEADNGQFCEIRIRRAAEKAFLLLGIKAFDVMVRGLAKAKCQRYLGHLVTQLSAEQLTDFAPWIDRMTEPERRRLSAVVAARVRHGREYKRHLAENQDWIARAQLQGFNLVRWFAPEPQAIALGGRAMEITLAGDLHDIFLMGAYFHTCLGLGNANEMSVLSNAYDANKQVVFIFEDEGPGRRQVVARQLIAVSSDFRLLGYNCYMSARYGDKIAFPDVLAATVSYCGRLAAQCGLELTNEGTPATIGDHFWYDDGECEWPAEAQAAWQETRERLPPRKYAL